MKFRSYLQRLGTIVEPQLATAAAEPDDEDQVDEETVEEPDDEETPLAEEKAGARAARQREKARCQAILGATEAKGREALAQSLALQTDMTVDQARAVLATTPKQSARGQLGPAMASLKQPDVGPGWTGDDRATAAARTKAQADRWFAR